MMAAPAIPLRRIAGRFYRATRADRVAAVLAPPGPHSAGRYHRPGQTALYVTPEADWAAIAVGKYLAEDGVPRVIVPLEMSEAWLLDQHDGAACAALSIDRADSALGWRDSLVAGVAPASWRNADAVRRTGGDGIIDPSRRIVGGWHVALFRWNELDGPTVRVAGPTIPLDYASARARWPSPTDWTEPTFEGSVT